MAGMCLICALLLKKCLAVCLTLCLASDARRGALSSSGRGNLRAIWAWLLRVPDGVRRGLSHHKDGCSVCRSACWCVGGLIVCVVAAVSPALGFQCGPLPGVVLAGCGAVAVLVALCLPDLWMISPAECECSGQRGRRSGCVMLDMARDAISIWGITEQDAGRTIPEASDTMPTAAGGQIVQRVDVDFEAYRRACS